MRHDIGGFVHRGGSVFSWKIKFEHLLLINYRLAGTFNFEFPQHFLGGMFVERRLCDRRYRNFVNNFFVILKKIQLDFRLSLERYGYLRYFSAWTETLELYKSLCFDRHENYNNKNLYVEYFDTVV